MSKLLEKYNNSKYSNIENVNKQRNVVNNIPLQRDVTDIHSVLDNTSVFSQINIKEYNTLLKHTSIFGNIIVDPTQTLLNLFNNSVINKPVYIGVQSKLLTLNSNFDDLKKLEYSNVLKHNTNEIVILSNSDLNDIYKKSTISKAIPGQVDFIKTINATGFNVFSSKGITSFNLESLPGIEEMPLTPEKTIITTNTLPLTPEKPIATTIDMPITPDKPVLLLNDMIDTPEKPTAITNIMPETPEKPISSLGIMTTDVKEGRDPVQMPPTPEKPVAELGQMTIDIKNGRDPVQMPPTPEKPVAELGQMINVPKTLQELGIGNNFSDYYASGFTSNMNQTEYKFDKLDELRSLNNPSPVIIQPTSFGIQQVNFFDDINTIGFISNAGRGQTFYIMDTLPQLSNVNFMDDTYATGFNNSSTTNFKLRTISNIFTPSDTYDQSRDVPLLTYNLSNGRYEPTVVDFMSNDNVNGFTKNMPFGTTDYKYDNIPSVPEIADIDLPLTKYNNNVDNYQLGIVNFIPDDYADGFNINSQRLVSHFKLGSIELANAKDTPLTIDAQRNPYIERGFVVNAEIKRSFYAGMGNGRYSNLPPGPDGHGLQGFVFVVRAGVLLQQPIIRSRDNLLSDGLQQVIESAAELTFGIFSGRDMNLYNMIAATGIFNTLRVNEDISSVIRVPKPVLRLENTGLAVLTDGVNDLIDAWIEGTRLEEIATSNKYWHALAGDDVGTGTNDVAKQNKEYLGVRNGRTIATRLRKIYSLFEKYSTLDTQSPPFDILGRNAGDDTEVPEFKLPSRDYSPMNGQPIIDRVLGSSDVNASIYDQTSLKQSRIIKINESLSNYINKFSKKENLTNDNLKDFSAMALQSGIPVEEAEAEYATGEITGYSTRMQQFLSDRTDGYKLLTNTGIPNSTWYAGNNMDGSSLYKDTKNLAELQIIKDTNGQMINTSVEGEQSDFIDDDLIDFYFEDITSLRKAGKPFDDSVTVGVEPGQDAETSSILIPFRAILTSYSDDVSSTWESFRYMGRPDPIFKYGGFDRRVSISFDVAINSRAELIPVWRRINYLYGMCYPVAYPKSVAMKPPIMRITVGSILQRVHAILNGINFSLDKSTIWELSKNQQLPTYFSVQTNFTILYDDIPLAQSKHFAQATDWITPIMPVGGQLKYLSYNTGSSMPEILPGA